MKLRVEKGIPIPERVRTPKYPWGELEVGDSFFIPREENDSKRYRAYIAAGSFSCNNAKGIRLKAVMREEGGISGTRVWRVA